MNAMTGAVHVLESNAQLPHDQDFYDRQAADQRRDLLSDRDGRLEEACRQHGDLEGEHHHPIDAHLVTVGVGEISATAGGSQTLSVVRFIDDKIYIRAGQTVEWNNHDPVTPHTVTFGAEPSKPGSSLQQRNCRCGWGVAWHNLFHRRQRSLWPHRGASAGATVAWRSHHWALHDSA